MEYIPPPNPEQEQSSQTGLQTPSETDSLRSVTRLLVGGLVIGIDELISRLSRWEGETTRQAAAASRKSSQEIPLPPPVPEEITESNAQTIRYALVGLAFEAQDAIKESAKALSKAEKALYRRANPIIKPIASSRMLSPARKRFDYLANRGQQQVDRWISIGRQEETHSKSLTLVAINESVDDVIDDLADNPEIQQLIQAQTTSLVEEILEEVRERTVSTDIILEGITRSILHKKPRYQLPAPPMAVQNRAKSLRPKTTPVAMRGESQS